MEVAFRWSAADSAAHEAIGPPKMTMDEYFDWLARCPPLSDQQLRERPGPKGEPFHLDD